MPAKANSSIVVAMVLRQTINSNPAIPRQILNPARRCCARKEYNRAGHGYPHWHSFWIL